MFTTYEWVWNLTQQLRGCDGVLLGHFIPSYFFRCPFCRCDSMLTPPPPPNIWQVKVPRKTFECTVRVYHVKLSYPYNIWALLKHETAKQGYFLLYFCVWNNETGIFPFSCLVVQCPTRVPPPANSYPSSFYFPNWKWDWVRGWQDQWRWRLAVQEPMFYS